MRKPRWTARRARLRIAVQPHAQPHAPGSVPSAPCNRQAGAARTQHSYPPNPLSPCRLWAPAPVGGRPKESFSPSPGTGYRAARAIPMRTSKSKSPPQRTPKTHPTPGELLGLSPRQAAVLGAVALGLGDKGIADELHMSLGTVRSHMVVIFSRLGARNRAEAAACYGAASQKCLGRNDVYRARPARGILPA
jgi:DNA-binding CsgD family transcriptional regulator